MREWKRVGIVAAAMLLLGGACAPTAGEEQHHYGEWTVTEEATCTEAGERRRICVDSGCGKVEYEVIPATGHSWGDWETMTEATCAERGSHRHFCSVCGEAETEAIPATGKHVYGEWRGDDRGHWRSCLYCGTRAEEGEHVWNADLTCTVCDRHTSCTEGLGYALSADGLSYTVTGITAAETEIVIPAFMTGRP